MCRDSAGLELWLVWNTYMYLHFPCIVKIVSYTELVDPHAQWSYYL